MVPLIIEAGQAVMPWLHRTCQVGDIGNNALGVLIGFVVAVAVRAAWEATGSRRCARSWATVRFVCCSGLAAERQRPAVASGDGMASPVDYSQEEAVASAPNSAILSYRPDQYAETLKGRRPLPVWGEIADDPVQLARRRSCRCGPPAVG